jgi:hypothetical protein
MQLDRGICRACCVRLFLFEHKHGLSHALYLSAFFCLNNALGNAAEC